MSGSGVGRGTRQRARRWVITIWVALMTLTAAWSAYEGRHSFDHPPDCSTQILGELHTLHRRLPPGIPVAYVGPMQEGDCRPDWLARNALAPRIILSQETGEHIVWMREQGFHVHVDRPHIVLAWGDEGELWLDEHPEARSLYRHSEHAIVAWRP